MPDHYDEKDYEENRRSNRPEFGKREKFGTEFMDNLEQSAVGKFFDLSRLKIGIEGRFKLVKILVLAF